MVRPLFAAGDALATSQGHDLPGHDPTPNPNDWSARVQSVHEQGRDAGQNGHFGEPKREVHKARQPAVLSPQAHKHRMGTTLSQQIVEKCFACSSAQCQVRGNGITAPRMMLHKTEAAEQTTCMQS